MLTVVLLVCYYLGALSTLGWVSKQRGISILRDSRIHLEVSPGVFQPAGGACAFLPSLVQLWPSADVGCWHFPFLLFFFIIFFLFILGLASGWLAPKAVIQLTNPAAWAAPSQTLSYSPFLSTAFVSFTGNLLFTWPLPSNFFFSLLISRGLFAKVR